MPSFVNKVAIVTGAGTGIGRELAACLAGAGARLIINDLDPRLAEDVALSLGDERVAVAVPGDASDEKVIAAMVERAVGQFGQLDIAIANAGITLFGDFFSYPRASFENVMRVNLEGTFFLAQAAANQMRKQKTGGRLLLMSSVTGHLAHQHLAAYAMTKAAIEMLARNLVMDLSPHQITVNAIAPGATITDRTAADAAYRTTWSKITPLGRPASASDIAAAALFLVSDEARHITGQTLVVDGGWTSVGVSPY